MSRGQHRTPRVRSQRARWRSLTRLLAIPLVLVFTSGVARAYWTVGSGSTGNGAYAATSVNQGATPTASATGTAVRVSWAATTLASGQAVTDYEVKRYAEGGAVQTILTACVGKITGLTCTESAVPIGSWEYSVTPVIGDNWRGLDSARSGPVITDATPPTNAIILDVISGGAFKSGDTIFYRGSAAGSFTLTNAVTDNLGGSGPASSQTAALTGAAPTWTHTASKVSTPLGGLYVSNPFTWTAGTTSATGEIVTGSDVAGNTATTNLSFVNDTTGPTDGSVDAVGLVGTGARYSTSTSLSLGLAKGTDPSGVAATGALLSRATAALTSPGGTANGTCGNFGDYALISGGTDPLSPKADTVADGACYRYEYVVADTLGNATTYTSGDIKVDLTRPSAPSLSFSAFTNTYWSPAGSIVFYRSAANNGAITVTASSTDEQSGIAKYIFPSGGGWTSTPGALGDLGVNTYSWSGAGAPAGTTVVTAQNNAEFSSASANITLTADNTAPTAGSVTYTGGTNATTSVTVSFTTGVDPDPAPSSGLGVRLLQRSSASLTNGSTCGTYGVFATVVNGTNPTSPLVDTVGGQSCYKYQYVVSDNVGNQNTAIGAEVWDTAP